MLDTSHIRFATQLHAGQCAVGNFVDKHRHQEVLGVSRYGDKFVTVQRVQHTAGCRVVAVLPGRVSFDEETACGGACETRCSDKHRTTERRTGSVGQVDNCKRGTILKCVVADRVRTVRQCKIVDCRVFKRVCSDTAEVTACKRYRSKICAVCKCTATDVLSAVGETRQCRATLEHSFTDLGKFARSYIAK